MLIPQIDCLAEFLICEAATWSHGKQVKDENLVLEPGLSAYAEWILSFVQEMDVRTDLQRSWFHPANSLSEFLDLKSCVLVA